MKTSTVTVAVTQTALKTWPAEKAAALRHPHEQRSEPDRRRPAVRRLAVLHGFDDAGQHRWKKQERLDQHHNGHELKDERQPIRNSFSSADDHDCP